MNAIWSCGRTVNSRWAHRAAVGTLTAAGCYRARTTTIKSGWTLVLVCGEHRILVAAKTLHEAEAAALHREIELDLFYVRGLPPCRRALAIDPDSTITSAEVTSRR